MEKSVDKEMEKTKVEIDSLKAIVENERNSFAEELKKAFSNGEVDNRIIYDKPKPMKYGVSYRFKQFLRKIKYFIDC